MEFENMSEEVKWEARRVAAAFGVKAIRLDRFFPETQEANYVGFTKHGDRFTCTLIGEGELIGLSIFRDINQWIQMTREGRRWIVESQSNAFYELIVCGIYCLGIEEKAVWCDFNHPLSAQEKLELRLSMPHELWPKTWLGEEEAK